MLNISKDILKIQIKSDLKDLHQNQLAGLYLGNPELYKRDSERIAGKIKRLKEMESTDKLLDKLMPSKRKQAICLKCGEPILGDEDSICGRCA